MNASEPYLQAQLAEWDREAAGLRREDEAWRAAKAGVRGATRPHHTGWFAALRVWVPWGGHLGTRTALSDTIR